MLEVDTTESRGGSRRPFVVTLPIAPRIGWRMTSFDATSMLTIHLLRDLRRPATVRRALGQRVDHSRLLGQVALFCNSERVLGMSTKETLGFDMRMDRNQDFGRSGWYGIRDIDAGDSVRINVRALRRRHCRRRTTLDRSAVSREHRLW